MGGDVAIGFRFPDDSMIVQDRTTNNFPSWFRAVEFFKGDRDYIDMYLNMVRTDNRIPLAPVDYGLIFVDYKTNHLLSMQEYSYISREDIVFVKLLRKNVTDEIYKWECDRYQKLIAENRMFLVTYRMINKRRAVTESETLITGTFADFEKDNARLWAENQAREYRIDTYPLNHIIFEKSAAGARQMLAKLIELNVPIDAKARREWDDYIDGLL